MGGDGVMRSSPLRILPPCVPLTVAATLLAAGVDPDKCALFVQSDVRAHTDLAWVLSCIAPLGHLRRMVQFKEKSEARGADAGDDADADDAGAGSRWVGGLPLNATLLVMLSLRLGGKG